VRPLARRAGRLGGHLVVEPARRTITRPFIPGAERRLLLHCCHHKTGTVWFQRVLRAVGTHFGLPYENLRGRSPGRWTRVAVQHDSVIDIARLPAFVGSHMVRDPRDVVVSGYHYHLWTTEPAIVAPDPAYDGRSYQDHLRSLDTKRGLLAEIERASRRVLVTMAAWEYDRPQFLELRYEDAIIDEAGTFGRLFRHYGFTDAATSAAVEIAGRFGFERQEQRRLGEAQEGRHLRSGAIGQWQEIFDDDHKARFKELAGPTLIQLGYEQDDRW
jgi:hypothetical protein